MTQFEKSAPGTILSEHGATRFGRYTVMYIAAIALIVAIALTGVIVFQAVSSAAVEAARPQAGEVADGWMPGITEANRAARLDEARRTLDGWSSLLLQPETEAKDGWASYLLQVEPEVVDGWASRHLVDDE